VPDDGGHGREAGELGRPEPTLPRDQLEAVPDLAHDDRLEHTDLADRERERLERLVLERGPGLPGVRGARPDRDLEQTEPLLDGAREQRGQPPAETSSFHQVPPLRKRPRRRFPPPGSVEPPGSSCIWSSGSACVWSPFRSTRSSTASLDPWSTVGLDSAKGCETPSSSGSA